MKDGLTTAGGGLVGFDLLRRAAEMLDATGWTYAAGVLILEALFVIFVAYKAYKPGQPAATPNVATGIGPSGWLLPLLLPLFLFTAGCGKTVDQIVKAAGETIKIGAEAYHDLQDDVEKVKEVWQEPSAAPKQTSQAASPDLPSHP